jgi:type II secretory pathway component PulF
MQTYTYVGVDRSGRNVSGKMLATDELNLEEKLRSSGMWLVSAKQDRADAKSKAAGKRARLGGRGGRQELINFCTLMSFQLKVGIPMVTALQVCAEDCENASFREIIFELKQHVEAGMMLCEALEKYPHYFSLQFVSLVKAGEQSSDLPETFMELKKYMEWQDQIIADVRQATIYPIIVLIVVVAFVLILFTFVIPRFVTLLSAAKVELPLPTRIVFGVSGVIKGTWWIWFLLMTLGPTVVALGCRYSKAFAIGFDKFKFKMPLFGSLNHMLAVSRFAHNLGVMYKSGVSIVNALKLCRGLVGSIWVSTCLEDVEGRVEAGDTLSEALRRHPVFPGLLVRMVVMGEKTGNLDHALENVAAYFNLIVPRKIKKIFSIMEPALILFLVMIVGFVAMAIFLPILGLLSAIK